jgi:hypothetical protein
MTISAGGVRGGQKARHWAIRCQYLVLAVASRASMNLAWLLCLDKPWHLRCMPSRPPGMHGGSPLQAGN